jgi:hypothetical protein
VTLRGDLDRTIDERVWQSFGSAVHCNGNGACYNYDPNDAMCPSWKATRERQHSPKGRASLIREWLRLQGEANIDVLAAAQRKASWLKGCRRGCVTAVRKQGQQDSPRGVRRHGRLPGVQVLRGAVPDQGQCAGLPLALPRAVPRPLPAPAA